MSGVNRRWATAALAAAIWLWAAGALAAWRVAETAHFRVYSEERPDAVAAAARKLELYRALLDMSFPRMPGAPAEDKLDVFILSPSEMRRGLRMSDSVVGFYKAGSAGIAAFSARVGGGPEADDILLHEYAHHFLLSRLPFAFPAWYVEGFAEYFAPTQFKDDAIEVGRMSRWRQMELTYAQWVPLEKLLTAQGDAARRLPSSAVYAQGWLFVHYCLRNDQRSAALAEFLFAVGTGADPRTAFEAAFKTDLRSADRALLAYARGQGREFTYSRLRPDLLKPPAPATITELSAGHGDVLIDEAKLRLGLGTAQGRATMRARIAEAARRNPDDPYVQRAQVLAELRAGDAATALAMARAQAAARPDDWRLRQMEGEALIVLALRPGADRATRFAEARRALGEANRLAPEQPAVLFAYAWTRLHEPAPPSDNILEMLFLARTLAPQVPTYVLAASHALMRRGRHEIAERLLGPLAFAPHDSCDARLAARLLEQAQARRTPSDGAAILAPDCAADGEAGPPQS
jgi:hypothetical protein